MSPKQRSNALVASVIEYHRNRLELWSDSSRLSLGLLRLGLLLHQILIFILVFNLDPLMLLTTNGLDN